MRRAANTSIFPLLIMGVFLVFTSICEEEEDPAPEVYKTVNIGGKIWMAENLRTTKYNDGTPIPNVADYAKWGDLKEGAYCDHDNADIATYGRLYNWRAVNTGKLAPKGWHIPTDAEWAELIDYLGGESVAGVKLKEAGTAHWESPNVWATNETGFTALPGGYRTNVGIFHPVGRDCYWWSATKFNDNGAWCTSMGVDGSDIFRGWYDMEYGFSVRCVKDGPYALSSGSASMK